MDGKGPIINRTTKGECIHDKHEEIGYCASEIQEIHKPAATALDELAATEIEDSIKKVFQCTFYRWLGREGTTDKQNSTGTCIYKHIPNLYNHNAPYLNSLDFT